MDDAGPAEVLVLTILSQNTTDVNRDRAYRSLRTRFQTLDDVARAPESEVAEAIRVGGLHRQKARSIQRALDRIRERTGRSDDLGFLADRPVEEGMAWLEALPGVGPKTAGIVMLFSFGKPFFPVDTHIRRVMTRVGLVRGSEDPHQRMNALLPADVPLLQALHLSVIELGRAICHPRMPDCPACPIRVQCRTGRKVDSVP